jgi:SAM-dependent methyltransferase
MEAPIESYPEWYASDNGFNSIFGMKQAHKPIIDLALATLAGTSGNVLDLGCGNGLLLKAICDKNAAVVPFGVDSEAERVAHAEVILPQFAGNFVCGDMFALDNLWTEGWEFELVILMPGRLLEVAPERAAHLRWWLQEHARYVLVYAYGDWLKRYTDLYGLAREAGLALLAADRTAVTSLARVIKV